VLALACDEPHPILDGNVRRVLARLCAVPGRTGEPACVAEGSESLWYDATRPPSVGLPAPIARLLQNPPP
jgi:adenine-specific DNA glycosylase